MNGDRAMAAALCADIRRGIDRAGTGNSEVALCPPHILIAAAVEALAGSRVAVGAQDLDANPDGAFTGQVSAHMIADSGCRYVIVGHSERRALHRESDQLAAQKAAAALAAGLSAIVCVGETRAQREAGAAEETVARQLDAVLDAVLNAVTETTARLETRLETRLENMVIAYEPVWAIGTGLSATPEQAQQMHGFIRARLAAREAGIADGYRILYGGSMKPQNAAALIAQPDIDGGLIGGASLNAADFLAICEAVA